MQKKDENYEETLNLYSITTTFANKYFTIKKTEIT